MTDTFQPGALALVHQQAEDESLWFKPEHITEDILQKALRELHAHVEQDAAQARFTGEAIPPRKPMDQADEALQMLNARKATPQKQEAREYLCDTSYFDLCNTPASNARADLPGEGMKSAEEWEQKIIYTVWPHPFERRAANVKTIQAIQADARRGGPETGLTEAELLESIPNWYDPRVEMPKETGQYIVRLKTGEAKIIGYYNGPACAPGWDEPYHDQVVFWMPVEHLGIPKPADIK